MTKQSLADLTELYSEISNILGMELQWVQQNPGEKPPEAFERLVEVSEALINPLADALRGVLTSD